MIGRREREDVGSRKVINGRREKERKGRLRLSAMPNRDKPLQACRHFSLGAPVSFSGSAPEDLARSPKTERGKEKKRKNRISMSMLITSLMIPNI